MRLSSISGGAAVVAVSGNILAIYTKKNRNNEEYKE